ncbi:MAG: TIGR03067 domain-containing protein [Gemmataceae bacterium]|nr:TIGR03067 domain-containing protein [Gemmataceae bacterium]
MARVAVLACALACGVVAAADPPATSDLEKAQGNWKPLQCEYEGKVQMPANLMQQVTVVFDKSEYHLYFKESKPDKNGQPVVFRLALANVKFDESTTPKGVEFVFADGPLKGKKCHGIYELAGNQLKLCYAPDNKPKPTKFESAPGSGCFLETWARQPK